MVVVEASADATPSVVILAEDNAATELVEDGVNGVVVASPEVDAIAAAIVRIHEAGMGMRESTARWYAQHARELSIEASLATVLAGYRSGTGNGR
jgi:glycosyltransferase involved in cell wall biosynthesis